MEMVQKALGALLSMIAVAAAAMGAGATLMMLALLLVGLVDWSSGPQIAVVDSSGIADQGRGEQQEAPRPFN